MLSNFLRKILSLLSFWSLNDLRSIKSRDEKILKIIEKKLNSIHFNKKHLKKTHNIFNKKILNLLKNRKLTNFLRENFIQKMFFVHNRLFILKELLELKKDKNWILYKKLIEEDNVGNPVRYFLYPKSSGNRINHVYHLSVLTKEFNINLKKLNNVFEFGGGYGCMARIFSKINKRTVFTCFDTSIVNLLQYYYLKQNNLDVGFSKKNKFHLISNIKKINTRYSNSLFIANWSLSETPINFRKKFIKSIKNSKLILISFQENFENINNLKYFKNLKKNLEKKFEIKIIKNEFYKGNFFKNQKSLLSSTPSIWPTRGWVTSGFGFRKSPFTGLREKHEGWDIAARAGSKVRATADGEVVVEGREYGYGNMVEVDHGYGVMTRYGHNSKHLVKVGDRVKRGQVIALVGNTGRSTGPHVHYEVLLHGVPVSPKNYILED